MKQVISVIVLFAFVAVSVLAAGPRTGMHDPALPMVGVAAGNLSSAEADGLVLMREEELLAHDVYAALYEVWQVPIFANIASSELTHTAAVKMLLDAYGIPDPVLLERVPGLYGSEDLTVLYGSLVEQGAASLLDAYVVGATVEDLDISDLQRLMEETDNEDVLLVYQNLQKGSRNHLRAFLRQIEAQGGSYEAQYISAEELASIAGGAQETGGMLTPVSEVNTSLLGQRMQQRGGMQAGMAEQWRLQQGNLSVETGLLVMQNGSMLRARLSNGRDAEIKVLPEVAAQRAQDRLRLQDCAGDCRLELKEVGNGNDTRAVYEVQARQDARVLGLFGTRMTVRAEVDAETGDVVSVQRPWWSFLAAKN